MSESPQLKAVLGRIEEACREKTAAEYKLAEKNAVLQALFVVHDDIKRLEAKEPTK